MTKNGRNKTGRIRASSRAGARIARRSMDGTVLKHHNASDADHWKLHHAKARFGELVRRAKTQGPQHVTVYGREEVVVVSASDFRRLKGELSGQALINVMQHSPLHDTDIEPQHSPMPVRDVTL
jgi:prevent-host-death family protein